MSQSVAVVFIRYPIHLLSFNLYINHMLMPMQGKYYTHMHHINNSHVSNTMPGEFNSCISLVQAPTNL